MAAMLENYPDIQATFNLTPSLLRQLQDLEAGAKDLYQVHTEIPAAELSAEQKDFILSRFFDINPKIIARFPRYQEIADDRANSADWDAQAWLDLQVLFNLGWTDPDWLAQEPLAELVAQGRDFSEADKAIVLAEHARLVAEVIPLHKRLQDEGRIDVTMTPFFHPILPLLFDTDLARVAVPDIELPPRFSYPLDAIDQVQAGRGVLHGFVRPAAGGHVAGGGRGGAGNREHGGNAGLQWMATDEEVLARSLGMTGFARNADETVQDADTLYRPYRQQPTTRSTPSSATRCSATRWASRTAARPALPPLRISSIAFWPSVPSLPTAMPSGPHLVSVILDGENAWENYPNDGKEFLNNLYRLLEEEQPRARSKPSHPPISSSSSPTSPRWTTCGPAAGSAPTT